MWEKEKRKRNYQTPTKPVLSSSISPLLPQAWVCPQPPGPNGSWLAPPQHPLPCEWKHVQLDLGSPFASLPALRSDRFCTLAFPNTVH